MGSDQFKARGVCAQTNPDVQQRVRWHDVGTLKRGRLSYLHNIQVLAQATCNDLMRVERNMVWRLATCYGGKCP